MVLLKYSSVNTVEYWRTLVDSVRLTLGYAWYTFPRMTKTKPKAKPAAPSAPLIPTQFRFPKDLIEGLDAWVEEINTNRAWPQVTRADVVRLVLLWAAKTHPNLDELNAETSKS